MEGCSTGVCCNVKWQVVICDLSDMHTEEAVGGTI